MKSTTYLFCLFSFAVASDAFYSESILSDSLDSSKPFEEFSTSNFKKPPRYTAYILAGYIELPYAEIREQFTVYYDPKGNRSRVDYYDGLVKTIQRADKNVMYKAAFVSTESVLNKRSCFEIDGPVPIQPGIPDLTGFKYLGETSYEGHKADQWQFIEVIGSKKNTYTYIADVESGQPYRYEMAGYDSLFGSHFDKYYIVYNYFSPSTPDVEIFDPPAGVSCGGWPSDGAMESRVLMNPMSEFVSGASGHHDELFGNFKRIYNRQYPTEKEHSVRKALFVQNVRYIHSTNRAGKTFQVAINHLADRTDDELKALRGFRRVSKSSNAKLFNPILDNARDINEIPESIDWRLYGAVTPVKDQAVCGSCWSFGTTGTVEGAYFLKTRQLVRLSQQELVDCSWGEGNNGCDGGEDFQAYEWIKRHGLSSEDAYGPYIAQDGMCRAPNVTGIAKITDYVKIKSGDEEGLRTAIAMNGPISVAIDASHKSLSFYANGVYYDPQCSSVDLDHAVLAVGYGVLHNGQKYWLIKNSWSTYWGNDGYVLMSPKDNNCGVSTAATFVKM